MYQGANGGTSQISLGRSEILTSLQNDSTFRMFREDIDSVYSEVVVHWKEQGELVGETKEQSWSHHDATVESQIGRRTLDLDCWAYNSLDCPRALAYYMLERHKHLCRMLTTDVTVYGMAIEPGDIVQVTHPALPISPEPGQVLETVHRPGVHPETLDAVRLTLRQFNWPGCSSTSCQGHCETSNCEVSCQTNWQPTACWTCQTGCQTRCEHIACVTAVQLICANTDCQTSCKTGCQMFCMPTTMNVGCG